MGDLVDGGERGAPVACADRIDAFEQAVREVVDGAGIACTDAGDCELIDEPDRNDCYSHCRGPAAVGADGAADVIAEIDELERVMCSDVGEADEPACPRRVAGSTSCTAPWVARCVAGECVAEIDQ